MTNKINDLAISSLQDIAEQFGFVLNHIGSKEGFDGLTLTVKFANPAKQKLVEDAYGVKMGKVFVFQGQQFKVVEYVPTRPKYPIVGARCSDGKRFKFRLNDIG